MTAQVGKEQLALTLPGTMSHPLRDRPGHLETARPGLRARLAAALSGWFARRSAIEELDALANAQLADIGVSRAQAPQAFDAAFALQRHQDRVIAALLAGRIAGA
jgi:uncharacterized protein YjiS (DUF1127 family)